MGFVRVGLHKLGPRERGRKITPQREGAGTAGRWSAALEAHTVAH